MRFSKILTAAAVAGLLVVGCAQKESVKTSCFEPKDLDANHDGKLTKEEAKSFYTEEFKWFDQDNDGKIKLDDFVSAPEVKKAIDKNKDGIATEKEYVEYYTAHPCICDKYM